MFQSWIEKHRLLSFGQLTAALIHDHSEVNLLGGLLRFLSLQSTREILVSWSEDSKTSRVLKRASDCLFHDFPQIKTPSTSIKIGVLLRGFFENDYFGSHFATRNPAVTSLQAHTAIHALRTWVLVKGYQYAAEGCAFDKSLQTICQQLRMCCDDAGDTRKLSWFARLPDSKYRLNDYGNALLEHLENPQESHQPTNFGIPEHFKSALKHIIAGAKKPLPAPLIPGQAENTAPFVWEPEPQAATFDVWNDDADVLVIIDQHDTVELFKVEFDDQAVHSPAQVFKQSRSISLLAQEDHQFLRHSWSRPNQAEQSILLQMFRSKLLNGSEEERLLICMALMAIVCRKSMDTIRTVPISSSVTADWQLNQSTLDMVRMTPRRPVRWHQGENSTPVRTIGTEWLARFSQEIQEVLRRAITQTSDPGSVGHLWPSQERSPEHAFNLMCQSTPGLERFRSGFLSRIFEQKLFESSGDATFAHLITAVGARGISGAGAYPSWTGGSVKSMLPAALNDFVTITPGEDDQNCLGSEMDPDDQWLANLLQSCADHLTGISEQATTFFDYHNAVTAYTTMLLLCATGARPVDAMFESSAHIDLERGLLYLEDKVSPGASSDASGRIVPLPWRVIEFLRSEYLPYLEHVVQELRNFAPELAAGLAKQATQTPDANVPLLVLIREKPELDWCPVSTSALEVVGLLEGLTPWNLFRHRLATRLRTQGLDTELIDAQLGHASIATESYGEYSTRCFAADCEVWRRHLEQSLAGLITSTPRLVNRFKCPNVEVDLGYQVKRAASTFGKSARAEKRKLEHAAARKVARQEIQKFINGKSLDQLKPEEWNELGRSMLMRADNLPHPYALIRYDTLEQYIQTEWSSTLSRPKFKSWYSRIPTSRSGFSELAIQAPRQLGQLRIEFDLQLQEMPTSRLSHGTCALYAAIDLCLFGQISHLEVLKTVASANEAQLQLVVFQKHAYLEYREAEGKPCLRLACSNRATRMLSRALQSKHSIHLEKLDVPRWLTELFGIRLNETADLSTTDAVLKHLSDLVRAENSLTLPSVLAAMLHGDLAHYSLPRADWVRVMTGQALSFPATALSAHAPAVAEQIEETSSTVAGKSRARQDQNSNYNTAAQVLKDVQKVLREYRSSRAMAPTSDSSISTPLASKSTNLDTQWRRNTIARIRRILKRNAAEISMSIHAFVDWTIHLLERPLGAKKLDLASVDRYFNCLRNGFLGFGHSLDICDADADELTDFYSDVVHPEISPEVSEEPSASSPNKDKLYVVQRLQDFHRHAQSKFGLEQPDWSEISDGTFGSTSNPGVISLVEYQLALNALCPTPAQANKDSLIDAFLLVLCYRFGLRSGEAAHMARSHWVEVHHSIVVLVTGEIRKLKTRNSQRQVPLIGSLDSHESEIIRYWLNRWDIETGRNPEVPLFFDQPIKGSLLYIRPHRERIIQALRQSTRAEHTNLHHARHSFANRVGLALLSPGSDSLWGQLDPQGVSTASGAKRLLLCTENTTRRALWAVARLLGHASPKTTNCSYLHFYGDWSNHLVRERFAPHHSPIKNSPEHVDDLDRLPVCNEYLKPITLTQQQELAALKCELIVKYLRLRANGSNHASAVTSTNLSQTHGATLGNSLAVIDEKIRRRVIPSEPGSQVSVLATHIQSHRWERLIELARTMDARPSELSPEVRLKGLRLVSPSRQIWLWDESHFILAKHFLTAMDWRPTDVSVYRRKTLNERVVQWGAHHGFTPFESTHADGKKVIQLDPALTTTPDGIEVKFENAVSLVRSSLNHFGFDSFEFLLVWLCFCVYRTDQGEPNKSGSMSL